MLLGTQLFLAGCLGELIIRHSNDRNHYEIGEEIVDDTPAIEARSHIDELPTTIPVTPEKVTVEAL